VQGGKKPSLKKDISVGQGLFEQTAAWPQGYVVRVRVSASSQIEAYGQNREGITVRRRTSTKTNASRTEAHHHMRKGNLA
jgi:hypothetical protein